MAIQTSPLARQVASTLVALALLAGAAWASTTLGAPLRVGSSCGYGYGYGYGCSAPAPASPPGR